MEDFNKDLVFTIGIAGGSGCGKTLIVENLLKSFPNQVCYVKLDNYYKQHDDMTYEERCKINFDAPDSFDTDLLYEHIEKLQNGQAIETPIYDFKIHNRSSETVTIEPKKVIIIEGTLALHFEKLCQYMDTKIYVDVDDDIRILRRLKRDIEERGRTIDSVYNQYMDTVKPMYEKYVAPSKLNANLIIPKGGLNSVAIGILVDHIKKLMKLESDNACACKDVSSKEDIDLK